MRYDYLRRVLVVVVAGLLLPATLFTQQKALESHPSAGAQVATSHARVVRLSYVSGTVTLKVPGRAQEETALLNTPIQEGFELSTAGNSYAEVEFENGSTARLGEFSKFLFHELTLDANGNKLNGITFEQGYATFSFIPESHASRQRGGNASFSANDKDLYQVKMADATVKAQGKCEFRTDIMPGLLRVEVFKGSVVVATNKESTKVGEGKLLEHQPNTILAANPQKGIVKDDWDQWTEARDRQALLTEKDEPVHAIGPSYGWSDLNTYGEWVTLPGNRFGWTPYAPAGWSPYTIGSWGWYPGLGWTWISGDPWGWVTDPCGAWNYDASNSIALGGIGWYWMYPSLGCGLWNPLLADWYFTQGWIGWVPLGGRGSGGWPRPILPVGPRPPRPHPGSATQITAVPVSVFQNRQPITPKNIHRMPASTMTRVDRPPFEPNPPTSERNTVAAGATRVPATAATSRQGFAHATAPATILMGGDPARESLLLAHHAFHSGREPLRAAQGTTLGGRYPVYGSTGEFRGSASTGRGWSGRGGGVGGHGGGPVISGRSGGSGPVVASHGSSGGGGGGASSGGGVSGGGGGHSSGGGVASGGGISSGGGASAGGGGGHH